ncbi:MAG TPA: tlde1 domain-containing protein [Pseudolabrys sp.]|jgi:hypothetical protein
MAYAAVAFGDVPCFGGRVVSFGGFRRITRTIRFLAKGAVVGLVTLAAAGLLITTITLAAAWIVNTVVGSNPHLQARAPMGPGAIALVQEQPTPKAVTFAARWADATSSIQVSAALIVPQRPFAIANNVPLPPPRPAERANNVPLPRPHPAPQEIAVSPVGQALVKFAATIAPPPVAEKRAAPQAGHNKLAALPEVDSHTAVYDIAAHTVYLPNGQRLEAHSGLGEKLDDPRYVHVRMRGATPPNVYDLALREQLFHGVQAIRLKPVDDGKMFGRDGILAHTYMLGANGQSNGCVSFRDYNKFLQAFLKGEVDRMVVVADLGGKTARIARAQRGPGYRYAAND